MFSLIYLKSIKDLYILSDNSGANCDSLIKSLAQIENNQYYLKTTDLIKESQLAPELSDKIYKSFIDLIYINKNNTIDLSQMTQKDYFDVYSNGYLLTKKREGNSYWDYKIEYDKKDTLLHSV